MVTIEERIDIDRPVADVWDFISDPANVPVYNSNVIEYAQVSEGPRGVGTVDRGKVKVAGRSFDFEQEIIEYVPGKSGMFRSTSAPMGMQWTLGQQLEDLGDGGCRVIFHQEAELGGFFGKLGDPLVTRMYTRDIRSNLGNLKELLEAE